MKKLFILASILLLTLVSMAQKTSHTSLRADYHIVPLPRSIEQYDTLHTVSISNGDIISYPMGDEEMERNARFLQTYIKENCGIQMQLKANAKKGAITLALYTKKQRSTNPDQYTLQINKKGVQLTANQGEGIFRAIQTLRKSIPCQTCEHIELPYVTLQDAPRFAYRGQHLDVARHFFSADYIKQFIDILALHGINQFHWHITDDQGWRFDMKSAPELARKASIRKHTVLGHNCFSRDAYLYDGIEYGRGAYYTQEQMREIVQYAAERYINIIPEIDLPGHMVAALHVYPELGCTGGPYEIWPIWGVADDVLCAGNPQTLTFLKQVMEEVCEVFPSQYIHIGGDESPRVRWQHCPKCQAKMKELGLKKEAELQTYINKELEKYLDTKGRTLIGWDETLEGGLSEKAIVMSWRGYQGGIEAARQRHKVIMTPVDNCYLDYYQLKGETHTQPLGIGGYLPLSKVYSMEPIPSELTEEEKGYIWGPQGNLWTEYVVSPDHVEFMLLPRLAAMSEVQWLLPSAKDYPSFEKRLQRLEELYRKLGYRYCSKHE